MMPPATTSLETLAQADLLQMLARLLDRPDASRRQALEITDEDLVQLARCAGLCNRQGAAPAAPVASSGLETLRRVVHATRETPPALWVAEHTRLFDGPIPCPPNETGYVRRDKGAILADICGFYQAFGFRLTAGSGEKADHLISEMEFISLLLVMLAQARRRGNADEEEVTLSALQAFAFDHLDEWLPLFVERLAATTLLPLYADIAALLRLAWEATLSAHGIPRADRLSAAGPDADPGTPYECGMAEEP